MFNILALTFDTQSQAPFAVSVLGRSWEPIAKFELLQWTGLSDQESKDVYEGDLIKIGSSYYEVIWSDNEASFQLKDNTLQQKAPIQEVSKGKVVGHRFEDR